MNVLPRKSALFGCAILAATKILAAKEILPERIIPVPAGEPVPTIDFVRPLLFTDPILSPDGKYFAAYSKDKDLSNIVMICDLATNTVTWSMSGTRSFAWIDNTHLIFNYDWIEQGYDPDKLSKYRIVVVDIARPTRDQGVPDFLPDTKRGLNPASGFLWGWPGRDFPRGRGQVQRYWPLPADGQAGYCTILKDDAHYRLYRREKRDWIECPVDLDEITPLTPGDQPGEMIVLAPVEPGHPRGIRRLDTATGTLGETIYQDARHDCEPFLSFKRGTRQVNGVRIAGSASQMVWLDEKMRSVQGMVKRQFPSALATIVSTDVNENRFLVEVESDREPPVYYLVDLESKSVRPVKHTGPWIDPARMYPMQVIAYQARDGAKIEGFLTLPAGASKEHPAPMVAFVHAGPRNERNSWGWDASAQFFASRGYAYFQPNYRGSYGYDSRFTAADRSNFQKMGEDVDDGVQALVKTGLIDPARVAVCGIGFGSYLALSETIKEPTLYRCAILYGGVYDWDRLFQKTDSDSKLYDQWLERRLKDFGLVPFSPLAHSAEIKVPLFLTRNVKIDDSSYESQLDKLYSTLTTTKGSVPCIKFGDLNLYRQDEAYEDAVERLEKIEEFQKKYLAPR